MTKIKIQGKSYEISQQAKQVMLYFNEAQAIQALDSNQQIQITTITQNIWNQILQICSISNYKFPKISKVKTNDATQVIGQVLTNILSKKSYQQLNKIYQAAQFLIINDLKLTIAAFLACKVYIKPTLKDYYKKKQELKIKRQLTADLSRKMKQSYTFMNN